jgi:hypothetical protein
MSERRIIPLSRPYPGVFGKPVLDRVDEGLFTLRYFAHCMHCSFCRDQCCGWGVDIDLENVRRLDAVAEDLERFTGVPREGWFTGEVEEDPEFPGGGCMRTRAEAGACVFLDREKRGCRIHAFCLARGMDYQVLKPMVSALFPATFENGALVPADEVIEGSLICTPGGPSIYEGVRHDLKYYFGDALVAELDAMEFRYR